MEHSAFRELFDLVGRLARKRYQAGEKAFATLGLNHTEARLLTLLKEQGGQATQDALSNRLNVDRSNVGRALKALEERGYVRRTQGAEDGRTRWVQMTPDGLDTATELDRLRVEMAESFFGNLTEAQAETILELLSRAMEPDASAAPAEGEA